MRPVRWSAPETPVRKGRALSECEPSKRWRRARGALALLAVAACATAPEVYYPTEEYYVRTQLPIEGDGPQIEVGRPIWILDALNHYLLSLPAKLLLLNWHALDHRLTSEDRALLEHFIAMNQLRSVKVRHNQYAPIDELKRLIRNREVGAVYRYSLGIVNWLQYTLFPGRLFAGVPLVGGGDHFNPFTNSINVYSSDPTILLHEAGHAKDYVQHESRGTSFALIRLLPGVDLLQEAAASADAIRFLQCVRDTENELRAYRTLIPAYSTYIAGYFQGGLIVTLPIVAAGHVSGRVQSWRRRGAIQTSQEDALPGFSRVDFLPDYCVALQIEKTLPQTPEGMVE